MITNNTNLNQKLTKELNSFQNLWHGGFRTGYNVKRNQRGIEEYLKTIILPHHTVFEIGCGGGQWTRLLCGLSDRVICNDAKTASDNRIIEYLQENQLTTNNLQFFQAQNFELQEIEDNSLDVVFSYDVFCHISLSGQKEYIKNLYQKCKSGCVLMIMYADAHKYAKSEPEHISLAFGPDAINNLDYAIQNSIDDCDGDSHPGRWYFVGMNNFLKLCEDYGYKVIIPDLDIDKTNPITLFQKP
jgi:2-polyprenyl-3-methyl-5-hydroxy-6-metoxy-1,4-benzoquinol methylase